YGSGASIELANVSGSAASFLGLSDSGAAVQNGYDGFGLTTNSRSFGTDLDAEVNYVYDPATDLGSFQINIGGRGTQIGFSDLDSTAVSFLGLQDASLYSPQIPKGKDVAGT